jgi:hypothetical protein
VNVKKVTFLTKIAVIPFKNAGHQPHQQWDKPATLPQSLIINETSTSPRWVISEAGSKLKALIFSPLSLQFCLSL